VIGALTIAGGNVTATGSNAAGIGAGSGEYPGLSIVRNLSIIDGNIRAMGSYGAGIGSAGTLYPYADRINSTVENLTIFGGNISASGSNGAGIGSGIARRSGISKVAELTILGGSIIAAGLGGAGIGSGEGDETSTSTVAKLSILGGHITLKSSHSGIGFGPSTAVDQLTIANAFFDCSAVTSAACFNASSLTFAEGSVMAITNRPTVAGSAGWQIIGVPSLYFEYLSISSGEGLTSIPLIHLESIELPSRAVSVLTIKQMDGPEPVFEREVVFNALGSRGCAFSVGSIANYSILIRSTEPELNGRLVHDGIPSFSASGPSDTVYSNVQLFYASHTPKQSLHASPTATGLFTSHLRPSDRRARLLMPYLVFFIYLPW
jgi:hypothetical protein